MAPGRPAARLCGQAGRVNPRRAVATRLRPVQGAATAPLDGPGHGAELLPFDAP